MSNPICIILTIWRSLCTGAFVSGHDFETIKEKTPPNVHVLKCTLCGTTSTAWSWDSLEQYK